MLCVQPEVGLAHAVCMAVPVLSPSQEVEEDGLGTPDPALVHGRVKNSEALACLGTLLSHLPATGRRELAALIQEFPCLFGDTPSCTHLIEHDIDIGDAKPIKQRFYRVQGFF